ncbi:MAG: dihydroorotate dehydrogenase [bacterium]|nr:dihydroorotate dehydrogenase [bacterium]
MSYDARLSVSLPRGVTLRDPLLMSSGCWEFADLLRGKFDPLAFGGVVTKAVTPEERAGNSGVRIWPQRDGWLNSVGLKNPGVAKFSAEQLPKLLELGVGFFVNIAGFELDDFPELIGAVEQRVGELGASEQADEGVGLLGFELNLSCPNVSHGTKFATHLPLLLETVAASRAASARLLVAKLSPNVTDIVPFAAAAQQAGADAVTIANTYNGVSIDVKTAASRFARPSAGYSGAAVLPLTLYHIWQCNCALPGLPIFGSGGIHDVDSAVQHLLAGATVLQIGSALFKNPNAPLEIQAGLSAYLDEHGHSGISEIVGAFKG